MAVDCRSTAADMIVVALPVMQEWSQAQMKMLVLDTLTRCRKLLGCDLVGLDDVVVEKWSQGQG